MSKKDRALSGIGRSWIVGFFLAFVAGCRSQPQSSARGSEAKTAPRTSTTAALPPPQLTTAYPRARWRLADAETIDRTVLWFSHLLLRHAEARNTVSFSLTYWGSLLPQPTRSRAEAFALAQELAERASADPARFAELARRHSEDLPTKDEAGDLGGYSMNLLELWPQVLDALASLRVGESSRVVETPYGFHVFYRNAPPAERMLSGKHILIEHSQAPWGQFFARDKQANRTRAEALALANDVYRQAKAEPSRFAELVERYSEHRDAAIGGDFGSWSTREPSTFPARLKRLRELAVGEVGAPIETHLGFEIVRRTPHEPRRQYRARMLLFPFDELSSDAPQENLAARASALTKAESAAKLLAQDPTRFDKIFAEQMERQWEDGRELPTLSLRLAQLEFGQVTTEPTASEYGFLIAQRLEPEAIQPVAYEATLPAPTQPDAAPASDSPAELGF